MYNRPVSVILLLFALGFSSVVRAQDQDNPLAVLGPLVGGKWSAEGTWSNGTEVRQEIVYEWGLDKKIIKTKLFGVIDDETMRFGLRNEGVRAWDPERHVIRFWEFDVFGGVSEGEVGVMPDGFFFEYPYEVDGEVKTLRDVWTRVDDETYDFKVVMHDDGAWGQTLISMRFQRVSI